MSRQSTVGYLKRPPPAITKTSVARENVNSWTFNQNFHLCPVVSSPTLSKDKVVRSEELAVGSAAHRVHCARLKVNKNSLINNCKRGVFKGRDLEKNVLG